jgi:sortase (surface protein transpeptidase)
MLLLAGSNRTLKTFFPQGVLMKRALLLVVMALMLVACGSQVPQATAAAMPATTVAASVSSTNASISVTTTVTPEPTTTTAPPVNLAPYWTALLAANPECDASANPAVGVILIDKIELNVPFVAGNGGSSEPQLLCGPALQLGAEAGVKYLAGHHKTHTKPFENIWKLTTGDQIRITAVDGSVSTFIVDQRFTPGYDPAELQRIYTKFRDEVGTGLMLTSCSADPNEKPDTVSATHRTVVLAHKES